MEGWPLTGCIRIDQDILPLAAGPTSTAFGHSSGGACIEAVERPTAQRRPRAGGMINGVLAASDHHGRLNFRAPEQAMSSTGSKRRADPSCGAWQVLPVKA